jgi:hypothetical protein
MSHTAREVTQLNSLAAWCGRHGRARLYSSLPASHRDILVVASEHHHVDPREIDRLPQDMPR